MRAFLPLAFLFFLGTAQDLGPCDPIDPSRCWLPFPNNFWLRVDNVTGKTHLQFSNTTLPIDRNGVIIDPDVGGWNALDGYSPFSPIGTYLPDLQLNNVPHYWNMSASLDSNCSTVLLDTVTGERLPHWGELDQSSPNAKEKLFLIWPSRSLIHGRRYIVGMRWLVNSTGQLIASSDAFAALRDGTPTNDPDVENRRALFADIFKQLNAVGWQQSTLQLAWDFTVGTMDSITGKLTFMRDDGFKRISSIGGVKWEIVGVFDNYDSNIFRRIEARVTVPQYVNRNLPGATLVLDANGTPVYQGDATNEVTIAIPYSLANGSIASATVVQYGHGLFGSRTEVLSSYMTGPANARGNVLIASDWLGLCEFDVPSVYDMVLTDLTRFKIVPDRCQQGVLLALTLMRLLKEGKFAQDPAMMPNGRQIVNSQSTYHYTGNSQGGILGAVYMATTNDVTTGVLGVGGGSYSLLCPRSADFVPLFDIMKERYTDPLDRMGAIMTIQQLWDRAEPSGYMNFLTTKPLPNTQTHQILMQHALGDAQVSYVGAYSVMRSIDAVMFQSNVNEPNEYLFGFSFIPDDSIATTAAIVTWDFPDVPPVPETNIPPNSSTDTHEYVRRQQDAQDMLYNFFLTGQIKNTCGGPCHGTQP